MAIFLGALFGFFLTRNIIGALLGAAVGYYFQNSLSANLRVPGFMDTHKMNNIKASAIFMQSLYSCLGHLAKADGQVSQQEIHLATNLMQHMGLDAAAKTKAQQAFNEGKQADFDVIAEVRKLQHEVNNNRDYLLIFMEILVQGALSDGQLCEAEKQTLMHIGQALGFSHREMAQLIAQMAAELRFRQRQEAFRQAQQQFEEQYRRAQQGHGRYSQQQPQYNEQQALADAYDILQAAAEDDDRAIKKAYKRRMAEHHPDKLASKGLPPEALQMAKEKTQDIQAAYELIKKKRGF